MKECITQHIVLETGQVVHGRVIIILIFVHGEPVTKCYLPL